MPLFDHYEAKPGTLRDAASDADTASTEYATLSRELVTSSRGALVEVSETLKPGITQRVGLGKSSAVELARAASLSGGVMRMFADAIDEYNTAVDALNLQWDNAVRTDFGVGAPVCVADELPSETEARRDGQISAAREELRRELTHKESILHEALDQSGDDAAGMLDKGPDDSDTVVRLMAAGYISTTANTFIYPQSTVDLGKKYAKVITTAVKVWKAPGRVKAIRDMLFASRNLEELSQILSRTDSMWNGVLDAIQTSKNLDTSSMAALRTWLQASSEIAEATAAVKTADAASEVARLAMLQKLGLVSKIGKGFALAGIPFGALELWDTAHKWDEYDTTHKVTHVAEGTASIASGVAAVAILAGASGPAAPVVLVGAGLVAGGLAIYNNWDTISDGVSTAVDWAGDRFDDAQNAIGDGLSSAADAAGDFLSDLTPW